MASEILCKVADTGVVEVSFTGDHITKRELLRAIKAIKFGYRHDVLDYQRRNRETLNELAKANAEAKTENVGDLKNVDPERNSGKEGKGREGEGEPVKSTSNTVDGEASGDGGRETEASGGEARSGRERAIARVGGESRLESLA